MGEALGDACPSDTLERLIIGIAVLNGPHATDHVQGNEIHWPIDEQSIGFIVVIASSLLIPLMLVVLLATVQVFVYRGMAESGGAKVLP